MPIKVFLADDHRLLVEGFRLTLPTHDIDVVGVAYSLEGLAQRFFDAQAEVLVIDVRFDAHGGRNGLDLCEDILARAPATKIVVFSQFDDEWIVEKTYRLGALAFIGKDENTEVLAQAIRVAASGKEFFSPTVAQALALTSVKSTSPTRVLDDKELRVFTLIADGRSMSEAAETVNVSYKTLSTMVKSVKKKMNVESFADFTKLAIKFGLTSLDVKRKS